MKPVLSNRENFAFFKSQKVWTAEDPEVMRVAYFAGQQLTVIQADDETPTLFTIMYLGFELLEPVSSMDEAVEIAPEFAKAVLMEMKDRIENEDDWIKDEYLEQV